MPRLFIHILIVLCFCLRVEAQDYFSIMSYNVENAFDTIPDVGKDDGEFLPEGSHHWTRFRYMKKLQALSKVLVGVDEQRPIDIIGLCEVENDRVMDDLLHHTSLNRLRYEYVMTNSADARGVDVALIYSPLTFHIAGHESIRAATSKPTRDILHVWGRTYLGDSLDLYLVHLPSKLGGHAASSNRKKVIDAIFSNSDSVRIQRHNSLTVILGDFNDDLKGKSQTPFSCRGFRDMANGLRPGTYKYQGEWSVIDHILLSGTATATASICQNPFLLERDAKGGQKPFRTFYGPRYNGGISDHLPILMRICKGKTPFEVK